MRIGHAANRLHNAVEAAALAPRPRGSPGAQGSAHDAGPQPGERFGREPFRRERAWTVRLDEHVGLSNQLLQGFLLRSQIQCAQNACLCQCRDPPTRIGQVRRGDLQNVGAVLGEAFRARRPGEHAGEIKSHAAGGRLDRFSFSIGESEMRSMVMSG